MTDIMRRLEAADYLRISTRQLDRLAIPRHYIGRSPRYLKEDLIEYIRKSRTTPPTLILKGKEIKMDYTPTDLNMNPCNDKASLQEKLKTLLPH